MKINGKAMVAVAMVAGMLGATGCDRAAAAQDLGTTADQGDSVAQMAASWLRVGFGPVARPLPPPLRVEYPGRAPSPNHVWAHGYWRWDVVRANYVWAPGYWTVGYAPVAPPAVRVEVPGAPPSPRHFWVNGYWQYTGSGYTWVGGHWDVRRDGFEYVQPHWDNINGRWVHVPGHWVAR